MPRHRHLKGVVNPCISTDAAVTARAIAEHPHKMRPNANGSPAVTTSGELSRGDINERNVGLNTHRFGSVGGAPTPRLPY